MEQTEDNKLQQSRLFFMRRVHAKARSVFCATKPWAFDSFLGNSRCTLFTKAQRPAYRKVVSAISAEMLSLTGAPRQHLQNPAMSQQALSRSGTVRYSQQSSRLPTPTSTPTPRMQSTSVHSILTHTMRLAATPSSLSIASNPISKLDEITGMKDGIKAYSDSLLALSSTVGLKRSSQCERYSLRHRGQDESTCSGSVIFMQDQPNGQGADSDQNFHDLVGQRGHTPANTIRDHENQVRIVSRTHNATVTKTVQNSVELYVHDTEYKFEFHEHEFFFEFDQTNTASLNMVPDQSPNRPSPTIVTSAELTHGKEITVDLGPEDSSERTLFLRLTNKKDVETWHQLIWRDRAHIS